MFEVGEDVLVYRRSGGGTQRVTGAVTHASYNRNTRKYEYRVQGGDDRWYAERELRGA